MTEQDLKKYQEDHKPEENELRRKVNKKRRVRKALPAHKLHDDAADYLEIGSRTLHRLYERRKGPPRFMFAGRWHYPIEGLDGYVSSLMDSA